MSNQYKVELKVLDSVVSDDNSALIAGKLVSGDIYGIGQISLICIETDGVWELEGMVFPFLPEHEEGKRLIKIKYLKGSPVIQEGFTLVGK